jgi:hypothetical protein
MDQFVWFKLEIRHKKSIFNVLVRKGSHEKNAKFLFTGIEKRGSRNKLSLLVFEEKRARLE